MDITLYKSFLLICILMGPGALQLDAAIETVKADDREFHFKVDITGDPADLFVEVDPDSTQRYYTVTLVGIPPNGSVQISSAAGLSPEPLATTALEQSDQSGQPHQWVRLFPAFEVRGRRLAPLRVYPVAGGRLYRQVEVVLTYQGATSGVAVSDPVFDRIFKPAVANYAQWNQWPNVARPAAKPLAFDPFAVSSEWYQLAVGVSGLYRVTGAQLQSAGLNLTGLASDDLHLFNGGGRQLPVLNEFARPELREVAMIVEDGGDGVFDRNDYILFYGESVNRWAYGPLDSAEYVHNHYTAQNIYWLTASGSWGAPGLRIGSVDGAPDGGEDTVFTSYEHRSHTERDTIFSLDNSGHLRDYYNWYGTNERNPSFYIGASNIVPATTATARVVAVVPWCTDSYGLRVSGQPVTQLSCDYTSLPYTVCRLDCTFEVPNLHEGLNQFQINFNIASTNSPYLDFVELLYQSELAPISDRLEFNLRPFDGRARVELVDDFTSPPLVFDLGDPLQPRLIESYDSAGGVLSFAVDMNPTVANHFFASTVDRAVAPLSITRTTTTDLRAYSGQTDLIVVTAELFIPAVQEYIEYRRNQGWSVRAVTVEDIMDNFSWGLFDPTAIRDFLKYAYENSPSPAPSVVLMVGDGNYDYLNHMGFDAPNYVPPYIHAFDNAYAYGDDNYVYFGEYGRLDSDTSYSPGVDRGLDMVSGRWPVRNAGELQTIIDKTLRYEAPSDFGLWRTTVALVADDEFAGSRTSEIIHTAQADTLQLYHVPRLYSRDKIYAIEYPFVNNRKPGVNDAIVNAFDDGRLLVNYVGHGNPGVWAHERIFTVSDDIPRLHNYDRLPLVIAASCAIGAFDDPGGQVMAEELLSDPNGGAIAVISATRLVWSNPNKEFNQTAFDVLFGDDRMTMGEATYTAKMLHQIWAGGPSTQTNNDRAYMFIGDPLVELGRPSLGIRYQTAPDSLVALQPTDVSGEIVDAAGNLVPADGLLSVRVFDSDKQRHYNSAEHGGTGGTIDYSVDGAAVYRGSASIENGRFSFEFVPPLDIRYGGHSARIMTYAVLDTVDAAGLVDSIYVADSIADVTDSLGPEIAYAVSGREGFVSGDPLLRGDRLEISLSDPSGINLAGGLSHGVTLEIDGQSDHLVNLTGDFEYDTDASTSGGVDYALDSLTVGEHSFKIKAWDNANNSAAVEFTAEVMTSDGPAITDLLNYPNPMQETTRFSFYAARYLESFSLEIFTLSGRKIKGYSQNSLSPGYHDGIVWRGEDFAGDRVATGVYIYKATAHPGDAGEPVEVFGKVVVIN